METNEVEIWVRSEIPVIFWAGPKVRVPLSHILLHSSFFFVLFCSFLLVFFPFFCIHSNLRERRWFFSMGWQNLGKKSEFISESVTWIHCVAQLHINYFKIPSLVSMVKHKNEKQSQNGFKNMEQVPRHASQWSFEHCKRIIS
jgi:hypothetical protein